jgi:cytochrome b561
MKLAIATDLPTLYQTQSIIIHWATVLIVFVLYIYTTKSIITVLD